MIFSYKSFRYKQTRGTGINHGSHLLSTTFSSNRHINT